MKKAKKEVPDIRDIIDNDLSTDYDFVRFLNDFRSVIADNSRIANFEPTESKEDEIVNESSEDELSYRDPLAENLEKSAAFRALRARRTSESKSSKFVATKTYTNEDDGDAQNRGGEIEATDCFTEQMLTELKIHGTDQRCVEKLQRAVTDETTMC